MRKVHNHLVLSRQGQRVCFAPRATRKDGDPAGPARGTILHPTDYSEASRESFEVACQIARDSGSRLIVMHVAEPVEISSLGMAPTCPLPKDYRGAWKSRLSLVQPRDSAVLLEHLLEEGDVADSILRVARETQCELIVMSGRKRTWLGRLLKGSVTREVERKAPCPVLRLNPQRLGERALPPWGDLRGSDGAKSGGPFVPPTDGSRPTRNALELARALAHDSANDLFGGWVGPS